MTAVTIGTTAFETAFESPEPGAGGGDLRPGDRLGRYELLFPIATGGMARVYAARLVGEGEFQRAVALKVILPHLASDARFVRMFMDEAKLAARIRSPHVVAALELGRHDERAPFMVMDLVIGVSLRQLFDDAVEAGKTIPIPVLGSILVQAAKGLADAHSARALDGHLLGLVHRDVSPHNILVGIDGHARITDFGIALAATRVTATQTGELKGKLPYFSPEQVRSDEPDARSDVFSLGIVAWEMFAGQRLFDAPNPLAIARAVAAKPVAPLDTVREDVPKVVAEVVRDALERDLDRRLESAESFAHRLEEACKASTGLANAREVERTLRELCGPSVARLESSLSEALARSVRQPPRIAEPPKKEPRFVIAALAVALVLGALALAQSVLSTQQRVGPANVTPRAATQEPQLPTAPAQSATTDTNTAPSGADAGPGVIAPKANDDPRAASRARPKRVTRRRGERPAQRRVSERTGQETQAKPQGLRLRDIDEFDRERAR